MRPPLYTQHCLGPLSGLPKVHRQSYLSHLISTLDLGLGMGAGNLSVLLGVSYHKGPRSHRHSAFGEGDCWVQLGQLRGGSVLIETRLSEERVGVQ